MKLIAAYPLEFEGDKFEKMKNLRLQQAVLIIFLRKRGCIEGSWVELCSGTPYRFFFYFFVIRRLI